MPRHAHLRDAHQGADHGPGEASAPYRLPSALPAVACRTGRAAYPAWAKGEWRRGASHNMTRATLYFVAAAPLWIAGGLGADPIRRLLWWAAALAVEYVG